VSPFRKEEHQNISVNEARLGVSKSRSFAYPSFKPLIHFHITPSLPYFPIPTPPLLIVGPHLLRTLLKQYPLSFYSECPQLLDLWYAVAEDSDSVFSLQCLCHNKLAKTMNQSSTKPPLRESAPSPTPTELMNISKVSRSLAQLTSPTATKKTDVSLAPQSPPGDATFHHTKVMEYSPSAFKIKPIYLKPQLTHQMTNLKISQFSSACPIKFYPRSSSCPTIFSC
jgi:hypothetical protein